MPLSEQEQRLLDEMERSLYHNDADFVSAVGGGRGRLNYGALVLGILVGILGLGVVIAGVVFRQPLIGIVGFIAMFGGVLLALRRTRRGAPAAPAEPTASGASSARGASRGGSSGGNASGSGFMDRLNDRWERRDDDRNE
ncbi:DUF3040 domain-containing protein [Herbiconiux sp. KACC 21604]|uniref:DUF3040 domain-containing protein n=1 Tax=unclassified Herbiconiux TaxID=2618217 RepID=UPI0014921022|nr:DUF3040 domain-containing protein [Herbiconiux sp. SALV-R1]QJU53322.1 DUF3040 domain-containing protein [Herbiconiux sp. SALV-R1]WPO88281.1 DUF3040 domain-containing protein [Herbiconiux sp. KACC 21604]